MQLGLFVAHARSVLDAGFATSVSSPYGRPVVAVPPAVPRMEQLEPRLMIAGFTVATFGWFELREPSVEDVRALCEALTRRKVHACIVTSLPSEVVRSSLEGRFGYQWFGPWVSNNAPVGFLVVQEAVATARKVDSIPFPCARRVALAVGSLRLQAVYAPYTGKAAAADIRGFLSETLTNHKFLIEDSPKAWAWTCGDFNLRGVAPGRSAPPAERSTHAYTSKWFRDSLASQGLAALQSADTYAEGGALDIHIQRRLHAGPVDAVFLSVPYSDHALTVVKTDAAFEAAFPTHLVPTLTFAPEGRL